MKEAPKIVLMSATVDAAPLKDYFGGDAAVIDVPGRTFSAVWKSTSELGYPENYC